METEMKEGYKNSDNAVNAFTKRFKVPDLTVSRVPEPTLKAFKELANKEFSGDFGMLIKCLLDGYRRLQLYEGNGLDQERIAEAFEIILRPPSGAWEDYVSAEAFRPLREAMGITTR